MRFIEFFLLRGALYVGLPLLILALAVGPSRLWGWVKRGWSWAFGRRMDPEQLLTQVVKQHQDHVALLKKAIEQQEFAETEIGSNLQRSEQAVSQLDQEAARLAKHNDDLGAKAALYKLQLEQSAAETFRQQLARQKEHIAQSRRRLYQLELQLRQYEVGRSVLLSQLAEAKSVEQQYEIANRFDPFSAVANWQQAEGMVTEKQIEALAAERVHTDTADLAAGKGVDAAQLEAQLAMLKAKMNNPKDDDEPDARRKQKERG